jgi:hypothetical protein
MIPRIYADFQISHCFGSVPLCNRGTLADLERFHITLRDGMKIILYTEDADEEGEQDLLLVDAVAEQHANGWVATVDWSTMRSVAVEIESEALQFC